MCSGALCSKDLHPIEFAVVWAGMVLFRSSVCCECKFGRRMGRGEVSSGVWDPQFSS